MASLILPKWMRSEFRSDIITRPRGYSRAGPQQIAGAWVLGWVQEPTALPESEECKNGIKTAVRQIDHRSAANPIFFGQTAVKNKSPYF